MNKYNIKVTAIFAALMTSGIAALPKSAPAFPGSGPLILSFGNYVPNSSGSHERSDASAYNAVYALNTREAARDTIAYVDYHQSASEGGQRNRIAGVGVGQKIYLGNSLSRSMAFYYRGGLGAYFVHGANAGSGLPVRTQNATQAGVAVGTGLELRRGFVLDFGYTYLPKRVAGVSEGGLVVSTGIRF